MRTIVRVGGLVGGLAFILLYAAQTSIALAVVPGVALSGLVAGLGIAKWLEREWYGRQFSAGLRAGTIASSIAGLGALLSLLFLGPRDLALLAARSHLAALDFASIANAFGFLGWAGADVLAVVLAALAGIALAAVACQVFAWSKSAHSVKVITQARLAARALNRDEIYRPTGAPATYSTYGPAVHAPNLLGQAGASMPGPTSTSLPGITGVTGMTGTTPALGIIPPPTFSPSSVPMSTPAPAHAPASQRRATVGPAPASMPAMPATPITPVTPATPSAGVRARRLAAASPSNSAAEQAPTEPAVPAAPPTASIPPRRSSSAARRAEAELTDAMREALAAWAEDNTADPQKPAAMGEKAKPSRTPAPSAYLNSAPPVKLKRGRKKTDTQDWLC